MLLFAVPDLAYGESCWRRISDMDDKAWLPLQQWVKCGDHLVVRGFVQSSDGNRYVHGHLGSIRRDVEGETYTCREYRTRPSLSGGTRVDVWIRARCQGCPQGASTVSLLNPMIVAGEPATIIGLSKLTVEAPW